MSSLDELLAAPLPDFEALLAPVIASVDALSARRTELQAQLQAVDAEIARLDLILQTALPERYAKPQKSAPSPKRAGTHQKVGKETLKRAEEIARAHLSQHEEITQGDIAQATGWDPVKISLIFKELRNQEVLRYAGQSGRHKIYKLTRIAQENNKPLLESEGQDGSVELEAR